MFDLFISGLDVDACDEFMFRFINKDHQGDDLALMRAKWFDYRYLHPVVATYTYAEAFERVFMRLARVNFGLKAAKPFKNYDLGKANRVTLAGLWRGRQHADAMGMPYDVYIDLAMTHRLRFWSRTNMPRPAQLYEDRMVEAIGRSWEELQAGRLYYGAHEELRIHRFAGTTPQLDHHEWLFRQAELRTSPGAIMRRFVDEDLIPVEKVLQRLGSRADGHFD